MLNHDLPVQRVSHGDIDTVAMDGVKAIDPKRPTREADIQHHRFVGFDRGAAGSPDVITQHQT